MILKTMITSLLLVAAIIATPHLPKGREIVKSPTIEVKYLSELGLPEFLQRLAIFESDNNPMATNRFGMLGKYQFHPSTIRSVGIKTTRRKFLASEKLQDSAMVEYMKSNKEELLPYIQKYAGAKFRGVDITESGILAGAHFVGSTGVVNFFKYGKNRKDANGTTLTKYMKKFNGFDLKI